ncbi:MAG: galactokinase, partial [Mycobacteriales bacterium]
MTTDTTADAAGLFRRAYGREPEVAWRSPGRVNLIGDHTDHQGGLALPFAIDRYVTVVVASRDDSTVRVRSADYPGGGVTGSLLEQPPADSWASYVLGAAWLLGQRGLLRGGADVAVSSTLPVGAGLSSSAAVTCASVCALADLAGPPLSRSDAARLAQQVETDVVGAPVGLLDQTAVLFAAAGEALLIDFADGSHEPVPLPSLPWSLAVIDTHVSHAHAGGEYADRRRLLDGARELLGVPSLSVLAPGDLPARRAALGAAYPAVRHVVTENDRVRAAAEALRRQDVPELGSLMDRSHASLRDDLRVSCRELDLAVTAARRAGAVGARMTGGGFGGSVVALGPRDVART